jgi:hypothetical protein
MLLGARLHREHRLSQGAIRHATTLMVERDNIAPNERFLGLHRSKYPKLYRPVLALSPVASPASWTAPLSKQGNYHEASSYPTEIKQCYEST